MKAVRVAYSIVADIKSTVDMRLTHFEKATRLKTNKNKMKNAVVLPAHVVCERALLAVEDAAIRWLYSLLLVLLVKVNQGSIFELIVN